MSAMEGVTLVQCESCGLDRLRVGYDEITVYIECYNRECSWRTVILSLPPGTPMDDFALVELNTLTVISSSDEEKRKIYGVAEDESVE